MEWSNGRRCWLCRDRRTTSRSLHSDYDWAVRMLRFVSIGTDSLSTSSQAFNDSRLFDFWGLSHRAFSPSPNLPQLQCRIHTSLSPFAHHELLHYRGYCKTKRKIHNGLATRYHTSPANGLSPSSRRNSQRNLHTLLQHRGRTHGTCNGEAQAKNASISRALPPPSGSLDLLYCVFIPAEIYVRPGLFCCTPLPAG